MLEHFSPASDNRMTVVILAMILVLDKTHRVKLWAPISASKRVSSPSPWKSEKWTRKMLKNAIAYAA